jgi:large subunit ribosomal protein L32
MPVPKRKRSRARRDSRFAHKGMVMHAITACANCQASLLPHAVCHTCGFYKGEKVMATKVDRAATRLQARHERAAHTSAAKESSEAV